MIYRLILKGELQVKQIELANQCGDKEIFWCVPSRYTHQNILQYSYFRIYEQKEITTPASPLVNIIYVMDGSCNYEGTEVKKGDVIIYGIHKDPITSYSTDIELFTIDVDFILLYKLFGLTPSMYQKVLFLPKGHVLSEFGTRLGDTPMEKWVEMAESFWEELFLVQATQVHQQAYECVLQLAQNLQKGISEESDCYKKFGISRRHLQRQFIRFFGMTMRDYERIFRFYKAFCQLDNTTLAETAIQAGYYDQSHMNREFKQMAGTSPQKTAQHVMYNPLKETCRNQNLY